MKEKIKNDLPILVGILIAMVIVDVILDHSFDWKENLLKIITTIVGYFIFRFIELKRKENRKRG